jgi:hypothetical protein
MSPVHSEGSLSVLDLKYTGCLKTPSEVNSQYFTSQTCSGFTQCTSPVRRQADALRIESFGIGRGR